MDFEAWWKKQNDVALRMATPEIIAKAAFKAGHDSMKFVIQTIMGKIKKL